MIKSGKEKVRKFNIGHIKVHDSVVSDYAVLKATRRSWMVLCIELEENVVFCEDSGDNFGSDVDLCKALMNALLQANAGIVLWMWTNCTSVWIPPIAPIIIRCSTRAKLGRCNMLVGKSLAFVAFRRSRQRGWGCAGGSLGQRCSQGSTGTKAGSGVLNSSATSKERQ